jgi:hypothetical protein
MSASRAWAMRKLRVRRRLGRLPPSKELLVSFSPGRNREHDGDLGRIRPRQLDEVAGEVDDAHRLAHLEHQDLAAASLQPRLQQGAGWPPTAT